MPAALDLGSFSAALSGASSFAEALKGWDQAARQNRALANQIRSSREREELLRSQMKENYQLGGGSGGRASSGGTTSSGGRRSAGGLDVDPVTLRDALAGLAADESARQQQLQGAEAMLAAEQAGAGRRQLLTEGPSYLRQRQEMAALEGLPARAVPEYNPWTEEGAQRAEFEARQANPWGLEPGTPQYQAMMEARLADALSGGAAPVAGAPVIAAAPVAAAPPRTVERGDTLTGIARDLGLPASEVIESARPVTHPGGKAREIRRGGKVVLSGSDLIYPKDEIPLPTAPATADEAVDPATVVGSEESVAAGLSEGPAEIGPLASKLLGFDTPGSIEEAKAQIAAVNESEGLTNPIAEFSGVTDETYLPGMQRLNYAVGLAKRGDRAMISSIMGRSVGRSEVKELDELVANYRDYTRGVELKADEIYESRELEALEKEKAKGDLFGELVESTLAKLHPKLSEEEVGLLADQLGEMSVYDRPGASSILTLWKGMRDTELREIAARRKERRDRAAAASKGYGGNKAVFSRYKEHHDQWNDAERRVSDILAALAAVGVSTPGDVNNDGKENTPEDRAEHKRKLEASLWTATIAAKDASDRKEASWKLLQADSKESGNPIPDGKGTDLDEDAATKKKHDERYDAQFDQRYGDKLKAAKSDSERAAVLSKYESDLVASPRKSGADPDAVKREVARQRKRHGIKATVVSTVPEFDPTPATDASLESVDATVRRAASERRGAKTHRRYKRRAEAEEASAKAMPEWAKKGPRHLRYLRWVKGDGSALVPMEGKTKSGHYRTPTAQDWKLFEKWLRSKG